MKKLVFALLVIALVVGGGVYLLMAKPAITQPIKFNHYLHTQENEIECIECHQYFESQKFSGLPDIEVCLMCHDEAITESPEEEKIRRYRDQSDEIAWKRLYDVPDHVFYSHRRHVVIAGIECKTCHGEIALTKEPPPGPLKNLSMSFCIDCHRKKHVTEDCIACHK